MRFRFQTFLCWYYGLKHDFCWQKTCIVTWKHGRIAYGSAVGARYTLSFYALSPLKRPYGGGLLIGWAACGRHLPLWTPHAIRLWLKVLSIVHAQSLYAYSMPFDAATLWPPGMSTRLATDSKWTRYIFLLILFYFVSKWKPFRRNVLVTPCQNVSRLVTIALRFFHFMNE
jgi:hypothetical protein